MFQELNITPPNETSVRNKVDLYFENFNNYVKNMFEKAMFYLIIDESQINGKRFVNVLIRNIESPSKNYLIDIVELLELPNGNNQLIIIYNTIKKFNQVRLNFYLVISNAVPYMVPCARNFKIIYPNLLHITYFAHAFHNCASKIIRKYSHVDFLIGSIKGFLNNNYTRKNHFSSLDKILEPIITKWGS